jgi:NADPH2:quinone reductase
MSSNRASPIEAGRPSAANDSLALPSTFSAVRFDRYGDRDVLYLATLPMPVPAHGEVLVAVKAAGINPGEAYIRTGALHDLFPATFPSGEGADLAGTVVRLGPGVVDFVVGDEVLGFSEARSSHATYVAVPAGQLIRKPAAMAWEVAGAFYVVASAAYAAARAISLRPGDTVAVSAASGGVGTLVVQLLAHRGVSVLGIASPESAAILTSLGATPVPYGDGLRERLIAAAPEGINGFIDLFGPEYVHLAVELGIAPDHIETIIAFQAAAQVGAKAEASSTASTTEILTEMANLVATGVLDVPIAATYPLEDVQDAYALLEQRHTHGKIVLLPEL